MKRKVGLFALEYQNVMKHTEIIYLLKVIGEA